jgi:hypothetical protein
MDETNAMHTIQMSTILYGVFILFMVVFLTQR